MNNKIDLNFKRIKNILIGILILNWGVAFTKIFYGYFIKSNSITADGFHSLGDGASNIIGLIGITFACKPEDSDHPYGHKKIENFTALTIAMMLFIVSIEIVESAFRKFISPVTPNITLTSFAVMLITLSINIWVAKYEYAKGKLLKSDILVSDSMHTKTDILVTCSVMAGLLLSKLGLYAIDPIISLFIAIFIGYSALKIFRRGSDILCDHIAFNPEKIRDIVIKIGGIEGCHSIRTRGREDDIKVDLHIHVNKSMNINDAHRLSDKIEGLLKKQFTGISEVIVHIEPEKHK